MTAAQEQRLRDELHRLRRPEDEFVYELVVVPSFTDAVTAVLFNFTIQACVIRRRFGHRSQHDIRPEIDLYLMAEVAVEEIAGRLGQDFRRVFHAREGSLERARFPAGADRAAAGGPAAGCGDFRVAGDVLGHQRHVDSEQDRGAA